MGERDKAAASGAVTHPVEMEELAIGRTGFPVHIHRQAAGRGQKYLVTCKGGAYV